MSLQHSGSVGWLATACLLVYSASGVAKAGIGDKTPFWLEAPQQDEMPARWRKEFLVDAEVKTATLRVTADFAWLLLTVNGERFAPIRPYDPVEEIDVSRLLSVGENRLGLESTSLPGPSAVAARLEIETVDGERLVIDSDSSWQHEQGIGTLTEAKTVTKGRVDARRFGLNRLPDIDAFAEYNQWKEALPPEVEVNGDSADSIPNIAEEKLSPLPPGFHIERLRTAAADEGSWVSMAVDERGRIVVAREEKGLLRISLPEQGGGELAVEVIDETLEECRGLAFRDGDLFANANRSKALYRLRDTTGDDRYDEITLLQATDGSTGHGRNDLALGPDGKIHAIHGDSVLVPENATLHTVAEPEGEAPQHLGHWARTDGEQAGDWQVLCRGLRNPYGIDFNEDGEAFTYDADNEGDVGLPFYRPTRINHLVSGANYGWHQQRGNTRSLPVYAPDTVPTTFDVGRGSPTAVKFGTRSNFPEYWKNALFALDWAYGRIIAVHLTPRGASYYGSGEVFLEGRPLNVTDLDFLPDGSMVFVTGGRKTQSALYRVRYDGDAAVTQEVGQQAKARAEYSEKMRALRRELEAFHGTVADGAVDTVWPHLGSEDPWIRNAARVALESQPIERWRERAFHDVADDSQKVPLVINPITSEHRRPTTAEIERRGLTAMLSLARLGTARDRKQLVQHVVGGDYYRGGFPTGPLLATLRILELCSGEFHSRVRRDFESSVRGGKGPKTEFFDNLGREECRVLSLIGSPQAVSFGLQRMASADDQMERLHYLEMLSEAPVGWDEPSRQRFFQALIAAERSSLGDRFMAAFFGDLKRHALANIADGDERNRYADLLEAASKQEAALAEAAVPQPEPSAFVKHWLLADFPQAELEQKLKSPDRNPAAGESAFSAALCAHCHVFATQGRPVGPDLTTVGRRFSPVDLLESILEPSKVVAEAHRMVSLTLKDGSAVSGRIVGDDFRQSLLTLAVNPFDPAQQTQIAKGDIQESEESLLSPMPTGLVDTLSESDLLDLLAWLISGAEKTDQPGVFR